MSPLVPRGCIPNLLRIGAWPIGLVLIAVPEYSMVVVDCARLLTRIKPDMFNELKVVPLLIR